MTSKAEFALNGLVRVKGMLYDCKSEPAKYGTDLEYGDLEMISISKDSFESPSSSGTTSEQGSRARYAISKAMLAREMSVARIMT